MDDAHVRGLPPPYYSTLESEKHGQCKEAHCTEIPHVGPRPDAVALGTLKSRIAVIDCPRCRMRAETDLEQYDTGVTLMLRLLVFPLGCYDKAWRWSMNTAHFCGNCNALLAIYQPFNGGAHVKTSRNYGPADERR